MNRTWASTLAAIAAVATSACTGTTGLAKGAPAQADYRAPGRGRLVTADPLQTSGVAVYDIRLDYIRAATIFHGSEFWQSRTYDADYVNLSVVGVNADHGEAYSASYLDDTNFFADVHSGQTVTHAGDDRFTIPSLQVQLGDRISVAFTIDSRTSDEVRAAFAPVSGSHATFVASRAKASALGVGAPPERLPAPPVYTPIPYDFPLWHEIPDGFPQPFIPIHGRYCDGYVAAGEFVLSGDDITDRLQEDGASFTVTKPYDGTVIACFPDNPDPNGQTGAWYPQATHTEVTFLVTRRTIYPQVGPDGCATPVMFAATGAPASAWNGSWRDRWGLIDVEISSDAWVADTFDATSSEGVAGCGSHARPRAAAATAAAVQRDFASRYTADIYPNCTVRSENATSPAPPASRGSGTRIIDPFIDTIELSNSTQLQLYQDRCFGDGGAYYVRYLRNTSSGHTVSDVMLGAYHAVR